MEALQTANTLMKEDLAIAKNSLLELQDENSQVNAEKDYLLNNHRKQIQVGYFNVL